MLVNSCGRDQTSELISANNEKGSEDFKSCLKLDPEAHNPAPSAFHLSLIILFKRCTLSASRATQLI